MFPHTQQEPRDDPGFLATVDRVIASLVLRDRSEEVYVVHIDNWFDHKWLRYSGYGAVPFHGGLSIHTAKEEQYRDQFTFPPFTPNRVVAQYLFCRVGDAVYEEQAMPYLIHRREHEPSSRNLNRRVATFSRSAAFRLVLFGVGVESARERLGVQRTRRRRQRLVRRLQRTTRVASRSSQGERPQHRSLFDGQGIAGRTVITPRRKAANLSLTARTSRSEAAQQVSEPRSACACESWLIRPFRLALKNPRRFMQLFCRNRRSCIDRG